jgi:GNAT superfamily N-acetyltransferase
MAIRPAAESDLQCLAEIYVASFNQADPGKPWTEGRARLLLTHFLEHQSDLFLVDDEEGILRGGMATLIKPWREGNRCTEGVLFVDPKFQKLGVGKRLFAAVLREALNRYDAQVFEGITFAANQFPLTWYTRLGFKRDEGAVFIKGASVEMLARLGE